VVLSGSGFSFSKVTAFDALWVANDTLIRVNPATYEHRRVLRIPLPIGGSGGTSLAADEEHLWIGTSEGTLIRIDPSGAVSGRREVADGIQLVAAGEGGVWVVDQFAGVVTRVDPMSLEPTAGVPLTGNIDSIAVMDDYLWTLDFSTGVLARISILEDRIVGRQTSLPPGPTFLAVGSGSVWVSHVDGTVTRVDPVTLRVAEFARVNGSARAIAVDEVRESIWVDVARSTD
jgi:outer membrane protein assembly factor BamB